MQNNGVQFCIIIFPLYKKAASNANDIIFTFNTAELVTVFYLIIHIPTKKFKRKSEIFQCFFPKRSLNVIRGS